MYRMHGTDWAYGYHGIYRHYRTDRCIGIYWVSRVVWRHRIDGCDGNYGCNRLDWILSAYSFVVLGCNSIYRY